MKKITLLLLFLSSMLGYSQMALEGFENTTGPDALPATNWTLGTGSWAVFDNGVGTAERWNINSSVSTPPFVYAGTNSAYMTRENIGAGNTSEDYLATPAVTIPSNGQLKFFTRSFTSTNLGTLYQIKVKLVSAGAQNVTTGYTQVQQWDETTLNTTFNIYEEKTVDLSAYSGQQVYVAFVMKYTQPATGTVPGDRWLVDNARIIAQCLPPTALTATAIAGTTATLGWTSPGGASSYEVENMLATATPTGVATGTATTTSFSQTGLAGLTNYKFYVRTVCGSDYSTWAGPFAYTTTAIPPGCGGNFVDAGGTANYPNSSNSVTTICPTVAGEKVTVTFTAFDVEASWDGLYVFNGNSTTAPQIASANPAGNVPGGLAGAFWGTTIPGPFTSTSADGCLTFRFRSDASVNRPGWVANVTCALPPTCPAPTGLVTSAITSTTLTLAWNTVTPSTSWQVLALPCTAPAPTATSTGWVSATANSLNITGLTPDTCYNFYVRGVCSTTDMSTWAGPKTATTLIAPPVCGGTFVDAGGVTNNYPNSSNTTYTICPTTPGDLVTVTFTAFDVEASWDGLYVFDGNSTTAPQIASTNPAGNVPGGLAGAFWGTTIPGPFTSSSTDGCLTFRFRSDASVNRPGWVANVTCAPAPTCTQPKLLTATSITQSTALLGWTQPANPNGTTANTWQIIVQAANLPAPTASSTWITTTSNPYNATGLTPGTNYAFYVRAVCSTTDSSFISGPKKFSTVASNDECIASIQAPVNSDAACGQTVSGVLNGATASTVPANGCIGTDDDVWFHFVASSTTHFISFLNVTGTATTLSYSLFSGNCSNLTFINCNTTNSTVQNNLVPGQTYYVRVYSAATTPQSISFDLCIGTAVTCADAQNFCGATGITYASSTGVPSAGTVGCLFTTPNPSYFYMTVEQSGPLLFNISQTSTAGAPIDVDFVAWGPFTSSQSACTSIPANPLAGGTPPALNGCSYSTAAVETLSLPNAVSGQVYVVMITNFNGGTGTITFNQTNTSSTGAGTTTCCPSANFSYSSFAYCQNASNPTPTLATGATAGTFSSTTGLVINATTGQINLAASTPGTYVVTHTIAPTTLCVAGVTYTRTITITAVPNATFSYSAASYCKTVTTAQNPTFTGTSGGYYTASPSGLTINATTGAITPSTSTVGNYVVSYTIYSNGGCNTFTTTQNVSIILQASASFSYDTMAYCKTGTNPILSYTNGGVAGTFSASPTGLSINASTGAINLSASSVGSYTIINSIAAAGGCLAVSATFDLTITAPQDATFSYTGTPYCQNAANPSPTLATGSSAGVFSSTTGLSINSSTGLVNLASSTPGTYTVTNTIAATGGCAASIKTATIVITAAPQASIAYGTPFCSSESNVQAVTFTGTTGGSFSASPTGLTLNATTGGITPSTSTPGTYTVKYTIAAAGGCPLLEKTTPVTITAPFNVVLSGGCEGNTFKLKAEPVNNSFNPTTAQYSWSGPGIATNQMGVQTPIITQAGVYNVSITDASGCIVQSNITITSTQCIIQKGISPNNDDQNDFFDLTGLNVKELGIFNRYGIKVYSRTNYKKEWFGQSDAGEELPDGAYYYVIESDGKETKTGWVYINRENK
ncbi:Protein of unknown function precursor; putative adhesin [Flavobacterium branchiophilum FL-15]|uniref:Gliding motility-associated-like protein n=3 Tax=Flavobacterium branchiophilum TaxID=55197 RepID=G2Z556_FLABF|nr:fibronectin type III domain-containing protein [Flavobacterium branchiophilum]CCB68562.1 Protein of unknown function precursor; putative adhesin [Flavobacterium branchiophilum FL-15]